VPILNREALEGLRLKYAEMLDMRVADATAAADEGRTRARMAQLATRFPGALREIDDLELSEIRRRIAALDLALREQERVEKWMEALALFHTLARGALCAKRWLRKRKRVDTDLQQAYAVAASSFAFPEDARLWTADLARIALPPRGRVLDVVFARVARELGVGERHARILVFGVSRRERRGRRA
jgi:hypothetical protein